MWEMYFWHARAACGILAPQAEVEPIPPALEEQNPSFPPDHQEVQCGNTDHVLVVLLGSGFLGVKLLAVYIGFLSLDTIGFWGWIHLCCTEAYSVHCKIFSSIPGFSH